MLLLPLALIMGSYLLPYEYNINELPPQLIIFYNDEHPVSNVLFKINLFYPFAR